MASTEHSQTQQQVGGNRLSQYVNQEVVLFLIAVLAILLLASQSKQFLTVDNLLNQGRLLVEIGLVALPMTYIIISGGIDLSVGSIFGLSAVVMGYTWQDMGVPLALAIAIGLLVGALCGFINGFFITRVGVPPLIMTLATLALFRGMALGISQGHTARDFPDWFLQIGQGTTLSVPTQLWILLVALIISAVILSQTTFGRFLYAIGNNELGARFSGIPVDRIKLLIYVFSGFMAGLAGFIFTARVSGTQWQHGRHRDRLRADPTVEKWPVVCWSQIRLDDCRHRSRFDPGYPAEQLYTAAQQLAKTYPASSWGSIFRHTV
jgi:rhamnose transport system permease protein